MIAKSRRTLPATALALVLAGALLPAEAGPAASGPAAATPSAGPVELTFAAFNGRFSEPGAELGAVRQGPVTLTLASPQNAVEVLSHRLRLTPLGDGSHRAELNAALRGAGRLTADLSLSGGEPGRLVDDVVLPAQTVAIEGRVRVSPVADGYRVVPLELPAKVGLEIESALAGRLAGLCTGLTLLTPGAVDCGGLERALSRVALPLPEAGEELLLPAAALSQDERQRLDEYLGRAAQAVPAPETVRAGSP